MLANLPEKRSLCLSAQWGCKECFGRNVIWEKWCLYVLWAERHTPAFPDASSKNVSKLHPRKNMLSICFDNELMHRRGPVRRTANKSTRLDLTCSHAMISASCQKRGGFISCLHKQEQDEIRWNKNFWRRTLFLHCWVTVATIYSSCSFWYDFTESKPN